MKKTLLKYVSFSIFLLVCLTIKLNASTSNEKHFIDFSVSNGQGIALRNDGKIFIWGKYVSNSLNYMKLPEHERVKTSFSNGLSTIASGNGYYIVLSENGNVYSEGRGYYGGLGLGKEKTVVSSFTLIPTESFNNEKIIAVSAFNGPALALSENGNVYGWGDNSFGELGFYDESNKYVFSPVKLEIPNNEKILKIYAGSNFVFLLSEQNNVYVSGFFNKKTNQSKEYIYPIQKLFVGISVKDIKEISLGNAYAIILLNNGKMYFYGTNANGVLGTSSAESGVYFETTSDYFNNIKINNIYAGTYNSFAIDSNGKLYGFGNNSAGQLLINNYDTAVLPVNITQISNVIKAQDGRLFAIYLTKDGELYSVGSNDGGALGIGSSENFVYRTLNKISYSMPTYKLKYVDEDNVYYEEFEEDDAVNLKNDLTREGYTFLGWQYDNDLYKLKDIFYMEAKDTELLATWTLTIPEIKNYEVDESFIKGIFLKADVEDIDLGISGIYNVKITNASFGQKTTGNVATGDKVEIYLDKTLVIDYTVVIKGDVTGSGDLTIADVAKAYQYLKKKIDMEDYYKEAADVAGSDSEIKISDVAKLYQFAKKKINNLED